MRGEGTMYLKTTMAPKEVIVDAPMVRRNAKIMEIVIKHYFN